MCICTIDICLIHVYDYLMYVYSLVYTNSGNLFVHLFYPYDFVRHLCIFG